MDNEMTTSKNPFEIKIEVDEELPAIITAQNPFLSFNDASLLTNESIAIPQSASFLSSLGISPPNVTQTKSLIDLKSFDSNISLINSPSITQEMSPNTTEIDDLFDINNNQLTLSNDPFQPSGSYFDLIGLNKSASQLLQENQELQQSNSNNFFDDFSDFKISNELTPIIQISEAKSDYNINSSLTNSARQSKSSSPTPLFTDLPNETIETVQIHESDPFFGQNVKEESSDTDDDDDDEKRLKQITIRPRVNVQTGSETRAQFSIPLLRKPPKTTEEIQNFNIERAKTPTIQQVAVPLIKGEESSDEEIFEQQIVNEELAKVEKKVSQQSSFDLELPDEDDKAPLADFYQSNPNIQVGEEGWLLSIRHPLKNPQLIMKNAFQKITEIRSWSDAYVKIVDNGHKLQLFYPHDQSKPFHEVELKSGYKITELSLQQFDTFTKIHTFKVQDTIFKETMQLRPDRLITLPEKFLKHFTKPKITSLLDHTPIPIEIIKFAHLNHKYLAEFANVLHENFWKLPILTRKQQREQQRQQKMYSNTVMPNMTQHTREEITIKVIDEYRCKLDKYGRILEHRCRTRVFLTAFINDPDPTIEIGLNDCLRHGKEIVSRHDIIPVKTENWISPELFELNEQVVNKDEFDKTHCLRCTNMPDNQIIEIMRFRTRPRRNYELPLRVACHMSILGKSVEIRLECTASGTYFNKLNEVYCEDIQIRFPLPDTWVYLFRVEKRFRYGALHSTKTRLGKIKGLERFLVHKTTSNTNALMEASCGRAKYEQAFRSIVWRIDQLPAKNKDIYKTQLFVCRLTLQEYDTIPESFEQLADVSFTMPICAASKSQVRSISVNTCEDPPAKWVKLKTRFQYETGINYALDPSEAPVFSMEDCDELKHISQTESEDNDNDEDDVISDDEHEKNKSNLIDF